MGPLVLGVDPSLRHTGWALVELVDDRSPWMWRVHAMGAVATKKSPKKRAVRVADDDHRCVEEIVRGLLSATEAEQPRIVAVCAEASGGHKGQRAAKLAALASAAVNTLAVVWGVPFLQATPVDIKIATAGLATASKDEVRDALLDDPGVAFAWAPEELLASLPKKLWEHAFDAVGAVLACEPSQAIQMARRLGGAAA